MRIKPKEPLNHNQRWTEEDEELLKKLYQKNVSYAEIGRRLGRTDLAVKSKARQIVPGLMVEFDI